MPQRFDLLVIFNVLYAIVEKTAALYSLRSAARKGATIKIFDYVTPAGVQVPWDEKILSIRPPTVPALRGMLGDTGWLVEKEIDLGPRYLIWYSEFLRRFNADELRQSYSEEYIRGARSKYEAMHDAIGSDRLGAALISAKAA